MAVQVEAGPGVRFGRARARMVDSQLRPFGVRDRRVLAVMRRVPRELFLPAERRAEAYDANSVEIGQGQFMSAPVIVAVMSQLLRLDGSETALEVGAGSGYQAAVLSRLCRQVYTVERIPEHVRRAEEMMLRLGFRNVAVVVGDGSRGLPERAPFDRIIVTAAFNEVPPALIDQLKDGGILVMPVGPPQEQRMTVLVRHGREISTQQFFRCLFVPLIVDGSEATTQPDW